MVLAVDIEGWCEFYCKHDVKKPGTSLTKSIIQFYSALGQVELSLECGNASPNTCTCGYFRI